MEYHCFSAIIFTEAIYCRYGEPIATCVYRNSFENAVSTNTSPTPIETTVDSRPLSPNGQHLHLFLKPQILPMVNNEHSVHLVQSYPPLSPSSLATFPPKVTETFISQDNNQLPSQQLQEMSLSHANRPTSSSTFSLIGQLFGRPFRVPPVSDKNHPFVQQNRPPHHTNSETLNIHANNVYLNFNDFRPSTDILGYKGPFDFKGFHGPLSVMAIFNKHSNPYIHTFLETQTNGQGGYFDKNEKPLIDVLLKYFMGHGKDGVFHLDKTTSLPLSQSIKQTVNQSRSELNIPSKPANKQHSESGNHTVGATQGPVNVEATTGSGESFSPLLRVDGYFETHENRTGIFIE